MLSFIKRALFGREYVKSVIIRTVNYQTNYGSILFYLKQDYHKRKRSVKTEIAGKPYWELQNTGTIPLWGKSELPDPDLALAEILRENGVQCNRVTRTEVVYLRFMYPIASTETLDEAHAK